MKNKERIVCRAIFYVLIIFMVACVVVASCLVSAYPIVSYCLFGGASAALLAQLCVALGYTLSKSKENGFVQWATVWSVLGVVLAFVVLSPVILILRFVDVVRFRSLAKHDELNK